MGADGTFSHENEPEEVTLTISNLLNRQKKQQIEKKQRTEDQDISENAIESIRHFKLLPNNLSVQIGDEKTEVSLTRLEFKLYHFFMSISLRDFRIKRFMNIFGKMLIKALKYRVANLIFHLREKLELKNVSSGIIKTGALKGIC